MAVPKTGDGGIAVGRHTAKRDDGNKAGVAISTSLAGPPHCGA